MWLSILAVLLGSLAPALHSTPADTVVVSADHFRIYRSDGTPATIADIRAAIKKADVVFVGEEHDDPVSHYIEQQVLGAMYDIHGDATALSLEMFARDVQYIVDEYLAGLITESHFRQSSSPWSNYETDYKPLVEFAKERGLYVIAANAPRRYANRVTREGRKSLMALSDQARSFLAPLPYGAASEKYTAQWNEVMSAAMASMAPTAPTEAPIIKMTCSMEDGEGCTMDHKMDGEMKHEMGADHKMDGMEGHSMENMTEEHQKMHAEHMAAKAKGEEMEMECTMDHEEGKECTMDHKMDGEMKHEMGADHKMEGMKHEMGADHKMDGEMKHEMGADHKMDGEMKHEMGADHKMDGEMKHEMGADHKMEGMKHEAPAAAPAGPQHGGDTMLDAQTLWDATMAWSIAEHMTRRPGSKVVHMVGGFHSQTGTGTPEHLVQYRPGTRFMVITMKSSDDINTFNPEEHAGMGDFVILGDASLPRTYGTRTR